tara:strand:+ start:1407 stop:2258 length:852 start_codon:yes stop_codon:yes gene_type:complete
MDALFLVSDGHHANAMDALEASLKEKPPRLLSASDLHSRIKLLEDAMRRAAPSDLILLQAESRNILHFRISLFETAVRAYRTELQRRPSLLLLSHDLIRMVAHELCDPLQPNVAVNLSSTAKGLRVPMQATLVQLKQQHQEAKDFAALALTDGASSSSSRRRPMSIVQLRNATEIFLGPPQPWTVSRAHWRTLGTLVRCGSLPMLESLTIHRVVSLTAGLRRGGLPSLRRLTLNSSKIGDQAASALASALTKRAVPELQEFRLYDSEMGTYLKTETGLETGLE